ncbi:uncharacterized protein VTP21DRAFT_10432 [Calcarisporiella thermophila]|uniref:uncharacterized protein n=1 Tax=Calcarisporiella thermophila TaxID=911321 RepID=UPI0037420357
MTSFSVRYHCSCSTLRKSSQNDSFTAVKGATILDISSPQTLFSLHELNDLYFCEDCHQLRCPRCVQEEIVCYYCPNCLFEVPTASLKGERNRCARNCFMCPICQNTLSVLATNEAPQTSQGGSPGSAQSATVAAGPYYLHCGVCRWDSREIDLTFERPTGLALQLQKNEETSADIKEFERLKEHYEKLLRVNAPSTLPASILSLPSSLTTIGKIHSKEYKGEDTMPYEPVVKIPDEDMKSVDLVLGMNDIYKVTSLSQRLNQLHDQPYDVQNLQPQRINLRTKRSKRCRGCRHILIKPEQKAQVTRFKIKMVAINYMPAINISSLLSPLRINQPTQVILKFINPLYDEISISLATSWQDEQGECGKVTLLSPQFIVGPYNEVWEYDYDAMTKPSLTQPSANPHGSSVSCEGMTKRDTGGMGIYEQKANYTSIRVEIIPRKLGEYKFPLLVTFSYKQHDADSDDSNSEDASKSDKMEIETGSSSERDEEVKEYSFWCVIGLGDVSV